MAEGAHLFQGQVTSDSTSALPEAVMPNHLEPVKKPGTKIKTKRDLRGTYLVLFTTALLVNLCVLGQYFVFSSLKDPNFPAFFATVNIVVAILVRNEIFLN